MEDSKVTKQVDTSVRVLVLITAAIAILSLIAWITGSRSLLIGWYGSIPIRFNATLCLGAAAIGLWYVRKPASGAHTWLTMACGLFLCGVALATLSQDILGWNLHVDELIVKDTFSPSRPGRMSPNAAISFICAGIFLCLLRSARPAVVVVAQISALVAGMSAQWAVLEVLLGQNNARGISVNAAFAVLALALGMVFVPSERGPLQPIARDTSGGRILRRVVPTAIIAPIVLGYLRWHIAESGLLDRQVSIVLLLTACSAAVLAVAMWTAHANDAVDAERSRLSDELDGFFRLPLHSLLSIIGFDGRFRRISSSWEKVLGHSESEILRHPYLDFVHPDDQETTRRCAQMIADGTAAVGFENRYRTNDGSYRWFVWNAIPTNEGMMYAVAEDITERKQMERELRENGERLRLLIDGAREHALYLLDEQGTIASWNTGAERLTGYTAAEVLGRPFSMLYAPEVPSSTMAEEIAAALQDGTVPVKGWRVRKDGTRFFTEGYMTPLRDELGNLRGFAKIVRDVTERIANEEKIRRLNEELEERVEVRTAELAASNRELEAFAYSVSHDLRAPLRHLDGFLALLRRRAYSNLDDSARHYVDATMEASRRMGTLIDELLQFSRLGRSDLHRGEIDLGGVINEARRELQPETAKRVIRWNISDLPPIIADRTMVRQVMQNLLANALKFTRTRATAEISIRGRIKPDGMAEITVADNGVGFDMQYYNKLFGVFQRLHSEDEFEGTGIGLANVRRIVERHGGRVWAESKLGDGATFYFTLPGSAPAFGEKHELIEAHSVS